ncbi:MAG: O-antigen ligase family protein [Syntrophobacteraceae bacterium]|jgi:O-antigen ligase
MPRQLALLLCGIFVFVLLRIERRQNPTASFALWLPTVWMLLAASKPLSSWFGVYGRDIQAGSPLDRAALLAFLFVALVILAGRGFDWGRAFRENAWLLLLVGYELISICWSDSPFVSLKRWTREAIVVPMAFVVLSERSPRAALESIFRRTVYILIPLSVLLIKYYPEYGVAFGRWGGERMWIGVTLQKNGLGRLCLFAAFLLIWTLIRRWKKRDLPVVKYQTYVEVLLLLMSLWLLKGPGRAYPATAIGALALGLAALACLLRLKKRQVYLSAGVTSALIIALIVIGTLTPFLHGTTVGSLTYVFGRDETFTGRTDIWEKLVRQVLQSPILGHSAGGFWTSGTVTENFGVNQAHNGYLDFLLEYGFAGLLLLTIFLLSCCRKACRELTFDYDWGALWICFLLMLIIHNFAESSIYLFSSHLTAAFVFLSVSFSRAVSFSPGDLPLNFRPSAAWALKGGHKQ